MKTIEVVAGIISNNNKILCTQRKDVGELALKWEFPGGKIEKGESHQEALKRELEEELDIISLVGEYIMTVNHIYTSFNLIMHVYFIESFKGEITLKEHIDMKWLNTSDLRVLDWAEADIPIVDKLISII